MDELEIKKWVEIEGYVELAKSLLQGVFFKINEESDKDIYRQLNNIIYGKRGLGVLGGLIRKSKNIGTAGISQIEILEKEISSLREYNRKFEIKFLDKKIDEDLKI